MYQFVHKAAPNRNVLLIAGKAQKLNCRPLSGKSMHYCMPVYGRLLKIIARLPGKAARQGGNILKTWCLQEEQQEQQSKT
jgi:hypothetical protein